MSPAPSLTREEWLLEAGGMIISIIEERAKIEIPKYRVACSFPATGGLKGKKSRTRGQCWPASSSKDGHAEIMVSVIEDEPREVIQILAHELIHAGLPKAGHGKPFQRAAGAIGFRGPWTSSNTVPGFWEWADKVIAALPPYPHKELDARAPVAAKKPQKNRQIKCACAAKGCGYVARTSRRWIESLGPPHCPLHGQMVCELPED